MHAWRIEAATLGCVRIEDRCAPSRVDVYMHAPLLIDGPTLKSVCPARAARSEASTALGRGARRGNRASILYECLGAAGGGGQPLVWGLFLLRRGIFF
ncbi:MAG: hypothetical protein IPK82_02340 [Polyangiaceae bacterium]|nr:hypothetical protein [Polyangiaceae bacterium]